MDAESPPWGCLFSLSFSISEEEGRKKEEEEEEECHQRTGHHGARVLKERQTLRVDT